MPYPRLEAISQQSGAAPLWLLLVSHGLMMGLQLCQVWRPLAGWTALTWLITGLRAAAGDCASEGPRAGARTPRGGCPNLQRMLWDGPTLQLAIPRDLSDCTNNLRINGANALCQYNWISQCFRSWVNVAEVWRGFPQKCKTCQTTFSD